MEATGRPVELRGVDMIEIADGKNVTNTAYYDGMAFARGAGLLPPQDSGAERAMKSAVNAATRLRRAVADGRDAIVERRDAFSQRRHRRVTVYVTLVIGLVWWIAAWAFGIKAFDAFLLTAAMVVGAAAYMIVKPFLDRMLGREAARSSEDDRRAAPA